LAAGTYTPVHKEVHPYLPVRGGLPDIFPLELLGLGDLRATGLPLRLALVLEPVDDESALFLGQEGGRLGEVVQHEKGQDRDKHRNNALLYSLVSKMTLVSGFGGNRGGLTRMKIHRQPS